MAKKATFHECPFLNQEISQSTNHLQGLTLTGHGAHHPEALGDYVSHLSTKTNSWKHFKRLNKTRW